MKTKNRLIKLTLVAVVLLLIGGITNVSAAFIIGGYFFPGSENISDLPLDKITNINYAFASPTGDGSLQIPEPQELSNLISVAHAHGVKVSISIEGSSDDSNSAFITLSSNPTEINNFVNNIVNIVEQYNLDGVDIDWEYPGTEQVQNYADMMMSLSIAMHGREKLLTAAVSSEGPDADVISSDVFDYVDWLNIMSYDNADWEEHATYEYATSNLDYWQNRGLPSSKTVLGVPLYARPGEWTYREAIAADWENANNDCGTVNDIYGCYNGIPTVEKKTELMQQRGTGIMTWELSQDTTDDTSIINAIFNNLALNKPVTRLPNAHRTINSNMLTAGSGTNVTVVIQNDIRQALALQEIVPPGFVVTKISDDADDFRVSTGEWIWITVANNATKTVKYKITVPSDTAAGVYNIKGSISTSENTTDTAGDNTITVIQ